jgi:diphthamide biosynthesis methyltransferase
MSAEIVHLMMTLRNQVKLYHWQTMSYPRHKATDDLVTKLDENIDQFVEVYVGKYGRPKLSGKTSTIRLRNHSDKEATELLREAIEWMTTDLTRRLKKTDTDLLNIRDTIVADLNQTLYLFTFN